MSSLEIKEVIRRISDIKDSLSAARGHVRALEEDLQEEREKLKELQEKEEDG